MKTHLSLFSGIGGLDIASEMAGFTTVGQCEWAEYQTKVLEKHWPNVPKWKDIRTLTQESFYEKTGLRTVDIISGGFPCQPFSIAGKRGGKDDDRYLWPEMLRVIREICPLWVIGENVPGIVNMALDEVLSELEETGFEAQSFIVPACGVDAPHRRERVAIVAHAIDGSIIMRRHWELAATPETCSCRKTDDGRSSESQPGEWRENKSAIDRVDDGIRKGIHETDSDTDIQHLQRRIQQEFFRGGCYKHRLQELVELTPLGIIGRTAPEYLEYLMGYPIGWTDLNALGMR